MSIRRLLMTSREEVQEINITDVSVQYKRTFVYQYWIAFTPSFVLKTDDDRINVVIENSSGYYFNTDIQNSIYYTNTGGVAERVLLGNHAFINGTVNVTMSVHVGAQSKVFRFPLIMPKQYT